MKIISKFHDYYDGVLAMDTDCLHHYVRQTSVHDLKERIYGVYKYDHGVAGNIYKSFTVEYFIIGFCGKTYIGLKHNYYIKDSDGYNNKEDIYYGDEKEIFKISNRLIIHSKSKWYNPEKERMREISEMFEKAKRSLNLFLEYKTPVFAILNTGCFESPQKIVVNPVLADYAFYKVFDCYTAYQEIAMYVGNVLVEDKNKAWPVNDKLKVHTHGFDKYSFRKDKTSKRE